MADQTSEKPVFWMGFSKLKFSERIQLLKQLSLLLPEEVELIIHKSSLPHSLAENFSENVVGIFPLPLGIATNFVIDNQEYIIPMVTEENSIIAAASKTAKWIRNEGSITTTTLSTLALGQIQFPKIKNLPRAVDVLTKNKIILIETANQQIASTMVARGGGLKDMTFHSIDRKDGHHMLVIHLLIDTCDAMGANMINQVCEFLKSPIEKLTHEKVGICILSNLSDQKLTEAKIIIRNIDPKLGKAIQEASLFAQLDPYRAATNNKGILNGMDAILIATGNDWRAVEASAHAYAAKNGEYTSLSHWFMEGADLVGMMRLPIAVGIVGGVTTLHPIAKINLKLLKVKSAAELARVIAAVGLAQNLGALRALVTRGITQGHMKLHINNIALSSDATEDEMPILIRKLQRFLIKNKHITSEDVKNIITKIRQS